MADEFIEEGAGKKKIPTWVYIAGGGGLLLLLMLKGGSKSTTETDNLLAAEIDAMFKSHKEEEEQTWKAFKESIEETMTQRYGLEPPSAGTNYKNSNPPSSEVSPPQAGEAPDKGRGQEEPGYVPDEIMGGVFNNYIVGFNTRLAKVG